MRNNSQQEFTSDRAKTEVSVVPLQENDSTTSPPLVHYLECLDGNTAVAINRFSSGLHFNATVKELQEALDWYAAHPTGNRGRIIWCSMRLWKLQMRVGLWQAEFQKVESGFKIVITVPSGEKWIRLKKTDSLRDAKKAFCTFVESGINGNEPSSSYDLLGYPISEETDFEAAIATKEPSSLYELPSYPISEETNSETAFTATPVLVQHLNWAPAADLNCPGPHHDNATLENQQLAINWYDSHPTGNKGRKNWCLTRLRKLQRGVTAIEPM